MHRSFRSRPTRWAVVPVVVMLLATVAACGGSGGGDDDSSFATPASATAGQASLSDDETSSSTTGQTSGGEISNAPASFDQLVIRTGQVTLRVTNVGDALEWVRSIAGARAGYVFASTSYVQDDNQFAQVTLKVPAGSFDAVMIELRMGALVDSVELEESTSQDVSAEFVDNESLLASLRETHTRFLALLSQAETVDDILRLEYELTNVRSQIETLQGRQNYLDDATSFATITVSLSPVGLATPKTADSGFSATEIVESSWNASQDVVQGALTVTLTLLILGVTALPFVLAGWFVLRLIRNRRREPKLTAEGT